MYVGRIVAIARTPSNRLAALYRVSSRSFPNRQAKLADTTASIVPKPGFEKDVLRNPYIAYNCLRLVHSFAVATNGSQTDPIVDKLQTGMSMRDALVLGLHALDYERDDYNTPRIAAVVEAGNERGYLGIVRKDALLVREFTLQPGTAFYVCTYEHNQPTEDYTDDGFQVDTPQGACDYVLGKGVFADLERPVTAACALENENGMFDVAVAEAPAAKE